MGSVLMVLMEVLRRVVEDFERFVVINNSRGITSKHINLYETRNSCDRLSMRIQDAWVSQAPSANGETRGRG